jgi:hypothetical protein
VVKGLQLVSAGSAGLVQSRIEPSAYPPLEGRPWIEAAVGTDRGLPLHQGEFVTVRVPQLGPGPIHRLLGVDDCSIKVHDQANVVHRIRISSQPPDS